MIDTHDLLSRNHKKVLSRSHESGIYHFLKAVVLLTCVAGASSLSATEFRSKFLAIGIASNTPAFNLFSVDSLGQGKLTQNPLLQATNTITGLELDGQTYKLNGKSIWQVECSDQKLILRSDSIAGVEIPPFVLAFNQTLNHATLLGMMEPEGQIMNLPCVLHLPDMGSVRITGQGKIHYTASRDVKHQPAYVRVAFLPATPQQTRVEYKLEVTTIHPNFPGIENNPLYDGFRRDWLNIFQLQPHLRMLANNSASDICSMCVFEYADLAMHTPPLADGLTVNDLVRTTLDRYLSGVKGYGQAGGWKWKTKWTTSDSLPSLVIASCNYINSSGDLKWAAANQDKLYAWGREIFATDKNGNGLIEYPGTGNLGDRPLPARRPANWWDTINFGHEDAFSNALAYQAATQLAALARQLKHTEAATTFAERAAKLRAAYVPTYLNPDTGLLAGWKSADGQLHDYAFTFIQGAAITVGLVDDATANSIMDKLLAKMTQVGFTNFSLGLPGNLVPIKKGDYVDHRIVGWDSPPTAFGEPFLEDGSDGFQYYENGGATGCWAYYAIHALFKLGRVEDARRILHPMLGGFARGEFQGFDQSGMSRDWRDWKGGGHGYEGLLVDNYHVLLAVLDDLNAKKTGILKDVALSTVSAEPLGRVEYRQGDKLVVGFQKEPLTAPVEGEKFAASAFIHPFRTPGGFELTTIQPSDHLHHFGIWWPWKYIEVAGKKYNTWEIQELQGAHVTREVRELLSTNIAIKAWEFHNETIIKSKQGESKVAIREVAQVTVQATDEATVLDLTLHQKAGDLPVTIAAYRYSGFSWRGPQQWNKDNSTMLTSAGKGRDHANGTPARWVIVSGPTTNGMASILLLSAAERLSGSPEKLRVWGSDNQNGEPFVNFNPVMLKSMPLEEASPAVALRKYRIIAMDKAIDAVTAEAAWKKWMED